MTLTDDSRDEAGRLRPVMFDLWLPRGPELQLEVLSLRGTEALSQPYEFEVEVWADDPDADFEPLLGADCELVLERNGHERKIYGLIAEVEVLYAARSKIARDGVGVQLQIVPAFRLLEHELDTRFFSGRTVPEILADLLGSRLAAYERSVDVESRIKGQYNTRDYCVQFRESTFSFCSRLMEEEGIAYMFVPDDDAQRERMVLVDNNQDYAAADLLVAEPLTIVLDRAEQLDRESLQALHWRRKPAANRVVTRGYNYKLGAAFDEGSAEDLAEPRPVVREQAHEGVQRQIIDDPRNDPDAAEFDGSSLAQQVPLARRLLEAQRADTAVGRGHGNAIGFAAGTTFELDHALAGGLPSHQFLLTRVVHSGSVSMSEAAEPAYAYETQFECIPRERTYRPPRVTPKPRVFGVQTGTVIGKDSDEIYTDPLGRVRVEFHLHHHSQDDEHSSCWIRVAQIWAGSGYGSMVIPRVGMEVVVAFVDGDPDRPLITGCVYNGANPPPYELPGQSSKSTFKTSSTPGSDGFAEVRFEDAKGSEQVFVRAQRRMDLRVQGTLYSTCTGSREERVGAQDEFSNSTSMHNLTVLGDVNTVIKHDSFGAVEGSAYSKIEQNRFEVTTRNHSILARNGYQVSAPTITASASETLSQIADVVSVAGSDTVSVMAGSRLVLESNNAIELRVGTSFIAITNTGIDINGYTLRLNSGGGVGHAREPMAVQEMNFGSPFEALPADDGRIRAKGSGRGGGRRRSRERAWTTYEAYRPPPMTPPQIPKPTDPRKSSDGAWVSIAWKQHETWCSEPTHLLCQAKNPGAGDFQTVYIQDATDGEVVGGVGVTLRDGTFQEPVKICDVLPRSLPVGVESSRKLTAWAANGPPSLNAILFRFISDLPRVDVREGYARFSVRVRDHELVVSSNIPYKRGMMGYIISLGALAPPFTGGLIGGRIDGTEDWRYCKDLGTRAVRNLVYWDGLGWRPVPKDFKDGLGTKLSGIGVWKEGETVKTQYGTLPWPDEVPDWNPYSLTQLERALARWTVSIAEHWTSTFDIKRDQCHGHDPRCCRYPVKFDVDFFEVDKKVKAGIVIGENYARANDSAWPLESSGLTAAHEFGHHLGNPDEYPGAATVDVFVNGDGARFGIDKASIMGEGPVIRRRHFDTIIKVLAQLVERETGKSYTYSTVPAIKK